MPRWSLLPAFTVAAVALFAATLPSWEAGPVLFAPGPPGSFDETAVKDPSVVFHDGQWHVFYTARGQGRYSLGYAAAPRLSQLGSAVRHPLTRLRGVREAYAAAPQVFYFAPQRKWYLIYQTTDSNYLPVYSTNSHVGRPGGWSVPQKLTEKAESDKWIDFWVICDESSAWLFYTRNQRELMAMRTDMADFPGGWGQAQRVFAPLHEAAHIYRAGRQWLLLFEDRTGTGERRHFGAAVADRLPGPWTILADRFAAGDRLRWPSGAAQWTGDVSHGELLRSGVDQRLEIRGPRLEFLIQGLRPEQHGGAYADLPWSLGLIRSDPLPGLFAEMKERGER